MRDKKVLSALKVVLGISSHLRSFERKNNKAHNESFFSVFIFNNKKKIKIEVTQVSQNKRRNLCDKYVE